MQRSYNDSSRAARPLYKIGRRFYRVKELWVNIYPPLEGTRMQGEDPTLADVARQRRVNVGRGSSKPPLPD
jgi:hypothetical protein